MYVCMYVYVYYLYPGSPLVKFLRKLVYKDLTNRNVESILKFLRKLPWSTNPNNPNNSDNTLLIYHCSSGGLLISILLYTCQTMSDIHYVFT